MIIKFVISRKKARSFDDCNVAVVTGEISDFRDNSLSKDDETFDTKLYIRPSLSSQLSGRYPLRNN